MTSKERVLRCFAHEIPDRVPIDYSCNADIDRRLKAYYGLKPDDREGLRQALGVDFRGVTPRYAGPALHPPKKDRVINEYGAHMRWVEHETGGYWDYCDFPLKGANEETAKNFPLPDPTYYSYEKSMEACRKWEEYCLVLGHPGIGDAINSAGMVFSQDEVLVGLALEDPAVLTYINRKIEIEETVIRRSLEMAEGKIDLIYIGEDLGTQLGPMISLDLYRDKLRPLHQRFVDLAAEWEIPAMIHSCGSSSWAFEEFLDMGITVVDTLQPEAKDMSPAYLKSEFGGQMSFHGAISTAGPLAYGSAEEVEKTVRETLDIMMPGGGYALAPTHAIQDNSPTENVIRMYDAAKKYGQY